MTPGALEAYLLDKIPLARFMRIRITDVRAECLRATVPLEPNTNVHGTLFAGSTASLGLIAAWALLHARMADSGVQGQVVVCRHNITYLRPIAGECTAEAVFPTPEAWTSFVDRLAEKGRARITLQARLMYGGEVAAELEGEFAAHRG